MYTKFKYALSIVLTIFLFTTVQVSASTMSGGGYTLNGASGQAGTMHGGGYTAHSRAGGEAMTGGGYTFTSRALPHKQKTEDDEQDSGSSSSSGGHGGGSVVGLVNLPKVERFKELGFATEDVNTAEKSSVKDNNVITIISKDDAGQSFFSFLNNTNTHTQAAAPILNKPNSNSFFNFVDTSGGNFVTTASKSFFEFIIPGHSNKVTNTQSNKKLSTTNNTAGITHNNEDLVLPNDESGESSTEWFFQDTESVDDSSQYNEQVIVSNSTIVQERIGGDFNTNEILKDTDGDDSALSLLTVGAILLTLVYGIVLVMTRKTITVPTQNPTLAIFAMLLPVVLFATATSVEAATIGYSGYLSTASGPVEATTAMQFRLYTQLVGGAPVWSSAEMNVPFSSGSFNVDLNASSLNMNTTQYYVEVTVSGNVLSPREKISSVAYAQSTSGVQSSAVLPSVQTAGNIHYNTANNQLSVSDGASWNGVLTTSASGTTAIQGNATVAGYQVVTGDLTVNGATNLAATTIGGPAIINNSLTVNGQTTLATTTVNGNFAISGLSNVTTLGTNASGVLIPSVSDENLKNIDGSFTRGIKELLKLNPITYTWRTGLFYRDGSESGFSAQNVQSVIPEAVKQNNKGFLSLTDRPILATVVNAIKEIWSKLTGIDNRIDKLEEKIYELQNAQAQVVPNNNTSDEAQNTDEQDQSNQNPQEDEAAQESVPEQDATQEQESEQEFNTESDEQQTQEAEDSNNNDEVEAQENQEVEEQEATDSGDGTQEANGQDGDVENASTTQDTQESQDSSSQDGAQ